MIVVFAVRREHLAPDCVALELEAPATFRMREAVCRQPCYRVMLMSVLERLDARVIGEGTACSGLWQVNAAAVEDRACSPAAEGLER